MRTREEIQKLASELSKLTLHGNISVDPTMELALEVCRLLEDQKKSPAPFGSIPPSDYRGIRGALHDVNQFHRAIPDSIHQDIGDQSPALTRRVMRWKLLKEEVDELNEALIENDVHAAADAYADIIYVALGSAIMHIGAERFARVWDEVQRANMDKVSDNGKIVRREDGKILKPSGWTGPDIEKAFERTK